MKKTFTIIALLSLTLAGCQLQSGEQVVKPTDGRTVLTVGNQNTACEPGFNIDPANTTRNYSNEKFGISVDLPFNEKWGNEKFSVSPFEEVNKSDGSTFVNFGRILTLTMYEDCSSVGRDYSLSFKDAQPADAYLAELKKSADDLTKVQVIAINGLQVVKEEVGGNGMYYQLAVMGPKYTYVFATSTFAGEYNLKELEQIITTVKFL